MHTLPKISVITPSLDQARYIERTICSVLQQNYPNLEYIVVDGGSTDNTIEILKKYGSRLTWISEQDAGQSQAINKGMRMATGDIIAYLNSDDIYEKDTLRTVAKYFTEDPSAMWLTGRCRIIDENDREVRTLITAYKNFLLNHYGYRLLLLANPISQPATFWKREVLEEFGFFDENESLVMDYDYWLRIGSKYRPLILDRYLAGFRVHPASKTTGDRRSTVSDEIRVAGKYSRSGLINMLHYLHAAGMRTAHAMIRIFSEGGERS